MAKLSDLSLSDLYERKITSAVEAAIIEKENFSDIAPTYCEKVCKLKCKGTSQVRLLSNPVDILIVQDVNALNGKFDRQPLQAEKNMQKIIDWVCIQAGFVGLTYRITNLLKCELTEGDLVKGKPPTQTVLSKCKPYLLGEIERCKPKVIISLSTAVTKALGFSKASNTNNRGEILGGNVVVTLHPRIATMIRQNASGAMWGADYTGVIIRDFQKAAKLSRGELVVPNRQDAIDFFWHKRIKVSRTLDEARTFIRFLWTLSPNSIVSVDTETTGLDGMAEDARIITIQFGFRNPETKNIESLVIPLWHRENTAYSADDIWPLIAEWLESDRPKVMHNGKFDILYIWHTKNVRVKKVVFDTMLLLHDLDSGTQGCYSLKTAVHDRLTHLGFQGYEESLPPLTKVATKNEEDEDGQESDSAE
ncbi:uracil-DNA glycosylase family protein [Companilactobacillus sp.]|uniref:uracil-DNA glycosylase family protein n=1 Tax=Companilactobacillus sp. TaxID=2767905 RepID=UPI00262B8DCD|nr:uracil-DNA glycosylase family protein [Companilactobacillus sp.]